MNDQKEPTNNKIIDDLRNIKSHDIDLYTLNNIKTTGKVVEIYDGDTCKIVLIINNQLMKMNCRLLGVDTPEMKPSLKKVDREEEIINAYRCRNRLMSLVTDLECPIDNKWNKKDVKARMDQNQKIITVECYEFDKYGRLLVKLWEDANSEICVNDCLVEEHYAKRYDGGKKDIFTY